MADSGIETLVLKRDHALFESGKFASADLWVIQVRNVGKVAVDAFDAQSIKGEA